MRPNLLVVVLDCTRADHLSCYGYGRETSPFLDSLAGRGTRFANMVSSAPWTLPSHASLFTATYSASHGATDEHRYLSARFPTLAELLAAAGYETAAFCANPWVSPETGFGRGFSHFFTNRPRHFAARPVVVARKAFDLLRGRRDSGSFRTNRAVARWLGHVDPARPFFAFVHYNETHLKFHPPAAFRRPFLEPSDSRSRIRGLNQDCNAFIAGEVEMTEDDFRLLTALYDGELRFADSRLRELSAVLDEAGRLEDTVVVVTADHGENLGEHGLMSHKFCVYETLLRVPLIIAGPGVPAGKVSSELVQNIDIAPTLAGMAGASGGLSPFSKGLPLIEGGRLGSGHPYVFAERYRPNLSAFKRRFPGFDATLVDVRKRSVSDGRSKLIWHSDSRHEYYDLVEDPAETENLYGERPAGAGRLAQVLDQWLAEVHGDHEGEAQADFDELARRQLQGLGYID